MTGTGLRLGQFEHSGQEYVFDGNESLITLARPGLGKSQAHVIRNLLYLQAPAFVLDVKPEIYEATARWRRTEVGPVYRFAPGDRANSVGFNPFDFIPTDPVDAYTAIQRMVPLMMIPPSRGGAPDHWESRAAQLLAVAMADVALHNPTGRRDMTAVVDWFSPTLDELGAALSRLKQADLRILDRAANQIMAMPDKVRESVFETARRSVDVWGSPGLDRIVATTTFDFREIRRRNGTLYLCVTPEELKAYAGIIRAIFGQALTTIREDREAWQRPPVTFFMDEFPQLGYLQELEQMLALGRQSGLRLWLFAQTKGQIAKEYDDADRILEMLAVRCFMSPSAKLAQELSHELGSARNIWRDTEQLLATPQELAGPAYADKVIVLESRRLPARLNQIMAFNDPQLRGRYQALQ